MRKKDLQALWTQLGEGVADDADIPDSRIVEALQKNAHPVFQVIYDRGHGAATESGTRKVTELEGKIKQLETDHQTAVQQLADERKKQPDTEQVRQQYEEELEKLRDKHKAETAALNTKLQGERINTALQTLRGHLTNGERRLDGDYADVQLQKEDVKSRLRFRDDGTLEVLQAGKQIALAPADGVSPLELLASELKEGAPPKFVETRSDRGSGSRGDGGSGTGGGFFNSFKQELKEERESTTGKPDLVKEARKRLGVGTM